LSGRGLCDELITRPEESYRLCCVVVCDLETSRMGAPYVYDISHLRVNVQGSEDLEFQRLYIFEWSQIKIPFKNKMKYNIYMTVKFTLEQATKTQKRSRGIALLFV